MASKLALKTHSHLLEKDERPPVLHDAPLGVARLNTQAIEARSLLEVLSHAHAHYVLKIASGEVAHPTPSSRNGRTR